MLQSGLKTLQSEMPNGTKDSSRGDGVDFRKGTKAMFEDYAKACALKTNWKYWVFAQLMKPLGESFDKILGTSNFDHTANNAMVWLDQSFSLPQMRSLMTDQLKDLSVSSATLLSHPERFAQETVTAAANNDQLGVLSPQNTHSGQAHSDYAEQLDETDEAPRGVI